MLQENGYNGESDEEESDEDEDESEAGPSGSGFVPNWDKFYADRDRVANGELSDETKEEGQAFLIPLQVHNPLDT